jgi:hypothetical protein
MLRDVLITLLLKYSRYLFPGEFHMSGRVEPGEIAVGDVKCGGIKSGILNSGIYNQRFENRGDCPTPKYILIYEQGWWWQTAAVDLCYVYATAVDYRRLFFPKWNIPMSEFAEGFPTVRNNGCSRTRKNGTNWYKNARSPIFPFCLVTKVKQH